MRATALCAGLCLAATPASALPIDLAGHSFTGPEAFADDAFLVSGTICFDCLGGAINDLAS